MSLQTKHIHEFGPFRLDAAEHLLLRDGEAVPLTPKAFDLLLALVERHGHLLEKDELLKKVWPDTFVEEANLASNISQLRKALGDGENGQRFIETAPKRGYRFVANGKKIVDDGAELTIQAQPGSQSAGANGEQASNAREPITAHPATKAEGLASKVKSHKRSVLLLLGLLLIVGAGIVYLFLKPPAMPMVSEYRQITSDSLPKTAPLLNLVTSLATDGSRVYFTERRDGRLVLAQVAATGGETVLIPTPFSNTTVLGISANGSELLIGVLDQGAMRIWVMPVPGGSPRRLGDIAGGSAAWSPDGRQIAYASGPALHLMKPDGTESRKLVTLDGRPSQVR